MKTPPLEQRLAVCSWSLQPDGPRPLLEQLKTLQISRVQIALDPIRAQPDQWRDFPELCARNGITLVSGMFGTVGEDYSTMESIAETGGVVPDATWEENWRNIQATAALANTLGIRLVTFHAGFLPHDESDPAFKKLFQRLALIADLFAGHQIDLGLETGQETAVALRGFLQKLQRPNLGVNFDPANMILYDKGNPIEALQVLAPFLKQCHLKDANKTRQPGTWGEEVPVGAGQVNWREFFRVLKGLPFAGYCCFEREAGNQRLADIQAGRQFVDTLLREA